MPENGMTQESIELFYSDISNDKLNKIYNEYYGG